MDQHVYNVEKDAIKISQHRRHNVLIGRCALLEKNKT
jgi:hypothetical protein